MFLLIDSGNVSEIEKAMKVFPLAGVTTCPTIIAREPRELFAILKDIRALIGPERLLHAQVMGDTAEEMLKDAHRLHEAVDGAFFVKVPVTLAGFETMKQLHREGIPFTATAIHSPGQAFLAAAAGAAYLAPYVNRIDNLDGSGVEVVRAIAEFLQQQALPAKILAASFRNVRQITDILLAGAHTVTLSPDLVWKLAEHAGTDAAVAKFRADWTARYGAGKQVWNL